MEKAFFNSRSLKLCGVLHHVDKNSKEVVVMIHGYASGKDSPTYVELCRELEKRSYNCFRFDLPGNGESEGKFEEQTISSMIKASLAAISFLKKRGFDVFDLVGSSAGGLVAMNVALKEEINKMVLRCPVSDYPSQRKRRYGEKGINEWREKGFNYYDAGKRGLVKVNYSFYEDAKKHVMYKKVWKITCPVLIIHGDKDESVPMSDSEKLATCFAHAELKIIKGAGHDLKINGDSSQERNVLVNWFVLH